MFHQPPPDTRSHSGVKPTGSFLTITEEGNSEDMQAQIDEENCKHGRARPKNKRRRKKMRLETKTDMINSIADDIMFDILIRFPAQDIHGILRLVCGNWYKIIRTQKFLDAHIQRSAHGILIQNHVEMKSQLSFMSIQQGQIEITRLNYEPGNRIWCSCNGLILEADCRNHYALRVTNPATIQHFYLPPFFCRSMPLTTAAIAYAAATMEYKVIRRYLPAFAAAICTVGVDSSWRLVRSQHLSPKATKCFVVDPLFTEGFVLWRRGGLVLSLNVETEVITQYRIPSRLRGGLGYYYFSAVRNLALVIARGRFSWDLWEMNPESGEWAKVTSIDLEAQKRTIEDWICERDTSVKLVDCVLRPVGWLKYRQVLVFYVAKVFGDQQPRLCVAYNVDSEDIELIELDSTPGVFLNHTNSLVWLDGC